jgi:hypothetical protein
LGRFVAQSVDRKPRVIVDTIVTILAKCVFGPSFAPKLT